MLSATLAFQINNRNISATLTRLSETPAFSRDSEYFAQKIGSVTSADDFVSDYRLFSHAMKAFGLDDMIFAKGFVRKLLSESIHERESMVNQLANPRYREFAKAFNFGDLGATATRRPSLIDDIKHRALQLLHEKQAGQQNEGARLALYFQRKAPEADNITELFADKALYTVVQSSFKLPAATGASLDSLVAAVSERLDVADLRDPAKLQRLLLRFTNLWDASNAQTTANTTIALLTSTTGPSQSLMLNVQQYYTS